MSNPALVQAYWQHFVRATRGDRQARLDAGEFVWAEDEVRSALSDPLEAVPLLVALADAAPDEEALAYLGAGPVEDLLVEHATIVVTALEAAAARNPRFRYALRCAWFDDKVPPSVERRLRRFGSPP